MMNVEETRLTSTIKKYRRCYLYLTAFREKNLLKFVVCINFSFIYYE